MPNPGKGEIYETTEGLVCRITIKDRRRKGFLLSGCKTRDEAMDRRDLLADLASQFRRAGIIETPDARRLLETVATCSPTLLPGARQVAGELVGGLLMSSKASTVPTFEDFGNEWTDGKLAKRFPDHVREVIQDMNVLRLTNTIYPLIGSKPLDQVTRKDCDAVMAGLPTPAGKKEMARGTRRQYAGLMNRILNLAELAGHIQRNPLPKGWLPKPGPKKR